MNELGSLQWAKALYAEAEPLMRRALDILRSSLGDSHPNTITVGQNYDRLLAAMTPSDPRAKPW